MNVKNAKGEMIGHARAWGGGKKEPQKLPKFQIRKNRAKIWKFHIFMVAYRWIDRNGWKIPKGEIPRSLHPPLPYAIPSRRLNPNFGA